MRLPRFATLLLTAAALAWSSPAWALFSCLTTKVVKSGGGGDCTTIGNCLTLVNPLAADTCIDIQDSSTYAESNAVSVTMNGHQLIIGPQSPANHPVVSGDNTANPIFAVSVPSVTLQGMTIAPAGSNVASSGISVSAPFVTISSMVITNGVSGGMIGVVLGTYDTLSYSTVTVNGNGDGVYLNGASNSSVLFSSVTNSGTVAYALDLNASSGIVVTRGYFFGLEGMRLTGSNLNTIAQSTVSSPDGTDIALLINAGSSNTISQCYIWDTNQGYGAFIQGGASNNTIQQSTIVTHGTGNAALYITGSSSNTVTQSYISDPVGDAASLQAGASLNTISRSTMSSNAVGKAALLLSGVSSNTISGDLIVNSPGSGAIIQGGSIGNSVQNSTITGGVSVNAANGTLLMSDIIGGALSIFSGATGNTVFKSTVTGLTTIQQAATTTIANSYLTGSHAAIVSGSTGTVIVGSVLVPTGGAGVWVQSGGSGLIMSSDTVLMNGGNRAIQIDQFFGGLVAISSNTLNFTSVGIPGVGIGTMTAGSSVWISSNIFLPDLATGGGSNTALSFDGLTTGATVQYNSFYYRTSGGAAINSYDTIFAVSSPGLSIHHNRVSQNAQITNGNFAAIVLVGSPNSGIKYNDLYASAPAAVNPAALLVISTGSTGVQVMDNVFYAGLAGNTTASIYVDALSQSGFYANYNDYFNGALGSPSAICAGTRVPLGHAWSCAGPILDGNSISSDPLWFNTAVGLEDFHPKSIQGRWSPPNGFFTPDASNSLTIDSGDPNDDYSLENAVFNGGRVNMGSYGDTVEASESAAASGYTGCTFTAKVGAGQKYGSIGAAVAALPGTLTGPSCVVVEDGASYSESVVVANIVNAGFPIDIFPDPATGLTPTVSPPASSFAAFVVQNASVNIQGFSITAAPGVLYGVYASSANIQLSSITVRDFAGNLTTAGISLGNGDTLLLSTVAVGGASTYGVILLNGVDRVISSSITANGINAFALQIVSSSNTVSSAVMNAPNGFAIVVSSAGNHNNIADSTATTAGGFDLDTMGSSNTFVRTAFLAPGAGGVIFDVNSTSTTLDQCTVNVSYPGVGAVQVMSSGNAIRRSFVNGNGGGGVWLGSGGLADNNLVTLTTITVSGAYTAVNILNGSSSNTVNQSMIASLAGGVGMLITGSGTTGNLVVGSTITSALGTGVFISGSASGNEVLQSSITSSGNNALTIQSGAQYNVIEQSTMTGNSGSVAVYITNASSNVVDHSVVKSIATAFQISFGQNNVVSFSSITTNSASNGSSAYTDSNGASNSVVNSGLSGGAGWAVQIGQSQYPTISLSTMTNGASFSGQVAVEVDQSTGATLTSDYVTTQSTGILISGSTNSALAGDIVAAGGYGVRVANGSSGVTVYQTLVAPQNSGSSAGLYFDATYSGVVDVSTNIFMPGPTYQVFISTPGTGAAVSFSSNTFYPNPTGPLDFYGLYMVGANGASIQNNSFYYRGGDPGSGNFNRVALFAQSGANLNIVHNRFDDPNVVTGNDNFIGISLVATTGSTLKFNDLNGSGSTLHNAILLSMTGGSTGNTVKDNIFSAAFSGVSLNNDSVFVDAASASGLAFDYNDYFSANGQDNASCSGIGYALTQPWTCGTTQDSNSISTDPLWVSVSSGAEDFHPKSQAGHFSISSGWVNDGVTSPSIDAGDPAEPNNLEPTPNGSLVNQGSYGDTPEASKTPPGVCAVTRKVCKTGACSERSIQSALNSLPTTLPGYTCVLIEDSSNYAENVKIAGFNMNGSSLTVMLDPSLGIAHPTITPPSSASPGIKIADSSVTVSGIDVILLGVSGIQYGIQATSAGVALSSVSVFDSLNNAAFAEIAVTTGSVISSATVSVGLLAGSAHGIYLEGTGSSVSYSSVTLNGPNGSTHFGIYVNGASSTTISHTVVSMPNTGDALHIDRAGYAAVSFSSFNSVNCQNAMAFTGDTFSSVTNSYINGAGGTGLSIDGTSSGIAIAQSTIAASSGGNQAVFLSGSANSLRSSFVSAASGNGINLAGGFNNVVSSVVVSVKTSATFALAFNADINDSVSYSSFTNLNGQAVVFEANASGNTLSYSSAATGIATPALYMTGVTGNSVMHGYFNNAFAYPVYLQTSSSNTISFSSMVGTGVSPGLYLQNSSSNTFYSDWITATQSTAAYFDSSSGYNAVDFTTVAALGAQYGLFFAGASWNQVLGSVIDGGLWMDITAGHNSVQSSTMMAAGSNYALNLQTAQNNSVSLSYMQNLTGGAVVIGGGAGASQNSVANSVIVSSGGSPAVSFNASSTNTFANDFISAVSGTALFFNNATSNTVSASTITNASGIGAVLYASNSSTNAVSNSYIANNGTGFGYGATVQSGSYGFVFSGDTIYSAQNDAFVAGGAGTTITQSFVSAADGNAIDDQFGPGLSVSFSTLTSVGGIGLWVRTSTGVALTNSYVQGSTAVWVNGSTNTLVGASRLVGTGAGGYGLVLNGGSVGLTVSSSIVSGGASSQSAAIMVSSGNSGAIVVSSNTVLPGSAFGIYIATMVGATPIVVVSSNTIFPTVTSANSTCGLCINGVTVGVAISGNSIYYRSAGSMGANTAYGIYALSSSGLQIDHNRISNPGMVTGGGFVGAIFAGSSGNFKFNDLYMSGSGLASAYGLQFVNAGAMTVKDNAFVNGEVNPSANYTVTVFVDANSQTGYSADYNDYFFEGPGAQSYLGAWGTIPGVHPNTLSAWTTATSQDAHSVVGDPLWASIVPGSEDFHPKSAAVNGRYSPATLSFSVQDSSGSPSIDAADPAEPYNQELTPNGLIANCGSYGDTPQASKTSPLPGCGVEYTVAPGGGANYTSINQALTAVPLIGTTLGNDTCIVITQAGVISEEVDVYGIVPNNHRLIIMGHPNLSSRAIVDPTGNPQAFLINNDSVTIKNLDIKPSIAANYGVLATSAALTITGVNVDSGNKIGLAGLFVSTGATIVNSSVTVQNAYALQASGKGLTVAQSSFTSTAAALETVLLTGESNGSITQSFITNIAAGYGLGISSGANGNGISLSTVSNSSPSAPTFYINASSFNFVSSVVVSNLAGTAFSMTGGAYGNSVVGSALNGKLAGAYALRISGSSNTVATSVLSNPLGSVLLLSGGGLNAITLSTASSSLGTALQVSGSSGNVLTQDYFSETGATSAAIFDSGAAFNQIDQTTFSAVGPTAVSMTQSSSNTFTRSVFAVGLTGTGLNMMTSDSNFFAQDSFFGGNGSLFAAFLFGSSSNTFTQSVFTQAGGNGSALAFIGFSDYDVVSFSSATSIGHAGALIDNSIGVAIVNSTMTGKFGVDIGQSSGTVIMNSYIAGSTGVVVSGSEGTVFGGSVLVATSTLGFGVEMTGGSNGLQLSSSVVVGGANRGGLYLDNGNAGLIVVSTNIFMAGENVGLFLSTANAGTTVWVTSNTFLLAPNATNSPSGIFVDGLATGATIQNNAFLVRTAGSLAGNSLYGVYALNSAGLDIDHNRFSEPGLINAGTYEAIFLDVAPATVIKFNDFNAADAAGALLTNAYQLQLANSPNAVVRDNVFASSLTVTGSSATIVVDFNSQTGYSGDYNDFFSSAGVSSILWGLSASSFPWSASFPADSHSIANNPRWPSVVPGAEDFHPLSNAGRFVTGSGFNGGDGWSAATIGAADPSESAAGQPAPSAPHANLGSYGGGGEASKYPGAPTSPLVTVVSSYSVTVNFVPVGSTGQAVIASTSPSFTTFASSGTPTTQTNLAPQGLIPNTTYFLEVGALWGDLFVPNTTVLSTATLAAAPALNGPGSFATVTVGSITAEWQPNGNPLNVTTYTVVFTTGSTYPNPDAGNVSFSTTPVGNPPTVTYGSLNPNTTYFVFAAAINVGSQPSAFTLLGSTATVPAAPGFVLPSFLAASSTTLTVAWLANGDPVGITTFTVIASTAANFNAFASSVTLSTVPATGPTATLSGLNANTTYYFQVRAEGSDGQSSAWLQFGSTSTLAAAPILQSLIAPSTSQINAVWTAAGDPAGTLFVLQTATSTGFTGIVTSSYTYNLSASTAGLQANTTYFFQAAAINNTGVLSAFVSTGAASTLALAPATVTSTFPAVAASSMSVAWSANGNPAGTNYFVVLSTDSLFNIFATSFTQSTAPAGASPSATFNGLAANTTYYLRVQAVSFGGIATAFTNLGSTTTTPPNLLAPTVQTFTSITTGTITATWTLMPGATGYALAASTYPANPPTVIWTSSSPVGLTATTATVSGLAPNTTYFLFVQALGPGAASQFSAFPATATFVALPLTAASTFSGVNFTSVTVSWNADANPLAMTTYTVVASTASDFNQFASSVVFSTVPAAGPSATLTGMFANTTYYFEVQALGVGATMTAFVPLGSTTTPAAAPTVPAQPFLVTTSTEMVIVWGDGGDPLAQTTYKVVASTASDFNAGASFVSITTAPTAGPSAYLSGLLQNTTYFVEVAARGVNGSSSPFVVLGATATLAQQPIFVPFSAVTTTQIQANWNAPANPVGTLYELQTSSTPCFSCLTTSSFTYSVSVATSGLIPNTTYFFRVLALNSESQPTAFTGLGSTSTLAAAPATAVSTFSMVGVTSVTVNWLSGGNPLVFTTYTITASTAPNFNAFASSVTITTAPAGGPTATVTGLAFGTTWYFEVAALGNGGDKSAYAYLGSTYTALSNLVPLIVNFQGGDTVWRSNNNGLYDVRFQDGSGLHLDKFQVKASTSPNGTGTDLIGFTDVAVNLSPADSYTTKWALPAAVYNAMIEGVTNYVTVRVYNGVPSTSTLQDAFFVLKDTTPPVITDNVVGDPVVRSTATSYDVRAKDLSSGLAGFQYSASLVKLSGDQSLVPWTNIAILNGATSYTTPWALSPGAFAALPSGVTSYITVRAFDVAGNTQTVTDAFYILKDTVGPTVAISSPVVGSGYVSTVGTIVGTSSSPFPVSGTEVAVLDVAANLYWNPGASLFNSGSAIFMVAAGSPTWSLNPGIPYQDGKAYKIVARSSSTFNFYSTVYATAAFVADFSTPTVGVQAPVPNSTVGSLPVISGTALDPGGAASGLSSVEVRLQRLSDGMYWNWFTQTWGVVGISTVATGTTNWQVAPTPLLMANLTTNSSYYVAVRASDNATPPNQGNFFTQGATFTYANPTPPSPVSDLAAVGGVLPGQITLTWHATGENGASGIILSGQYSVFYATYAAAPPSTATAQVAFATSSVSPGAASVFTVGGLSAGVTYYLQIALQNTDGNWSGFSNQASTVATPAPLNAIEGHVVNSSTQGITGVEIDAWNTAGALVSTTFTLADGSGTYTVGGLSPGAYKLQATWTVNGVTSSVWQDSIPMGTVGVDYSLEINYALATLTGSLATLTTSAARTGFTAAALARPAAGGSFIEVAQRGRTITKVGVQPSGRWTVPNLLPGSYSVRAFTGVSFTDYQDVNLVEGQTMTIGFVFDPLPDNAVFAFPNPAKDSTTFRFLTPFAAPFDAVIDIFDIAGRLVKEIPGSAVQPTATPALYHADWDLTNNRGQAVASGVYVYIVKVKDGTGTVVKVVKKLAVVR
jgi:hypothetical protein